MIFRCGVGFMLLTGRGHAHRLLSAARCGPAQPTGGTMPPMRNGGWLVLVVALVLPGVILAPVWPLAGLGAGEDELLYYFPVRTLLHEFATQGVWPWLNPLNGLDRPIAADPQAGVFYPPNWLLVWLPPLESFAAGLWLHYSLALLAMHRLLRAEGFDRRAALLGALVFAFGSFLVAHRAHVTIVQSAAWAPLVFWRLGRYAELGGAGRLASAALVAAMQCLAGHVQIAAITAMGSAVFLAARAGGVREWLRPLVRWGLAWTAAAALFAVQWAPTLAYTRLCTRVDRGFLDFVENSLNPLALVSLVFPFFYGQRTPNFFSMEWWGPSHQVEQLQYLGLLPLLLALLALGSGWCGDRVRRAWIIVGLAGLLVALGQFAPPAYLLYWLPGASLLRVPARATLLLHLALAALAAWTLHQLAADPTPLRARLRAAGLDLSRRAPMLVFGAVLLLVAGAMFAALFVDSTTRDLMAVAIRLQNPVIWIPLVLLLVSAALFHRVIRAWSRPGWLWLIPGVTLIDLALLGWSVDVPRGAARPADLLESAERRELIRALGSSSSRLWIIAGRQGPRYTPGEYIRPIDKLAANTNILAGVPLLTDYGPLQPRMFHAAFPLKPWGELPETSPGDRTAIARFLHRPEWRRMFDVGWLLFCDERDPTPPGCYVAHVTASGFRLVRNPDAAGRAFFEDPRQAGTVWIDDAAPHRFTLHVAPAGGAAASGDRGTMVVVSRLALPGWKAHFNDERVPIATAADCLLAVRVPNFKPVVIEFAYFPPGLRTGAALSLLAAGGLVVLVWIERAATRRSPPVP